MQSHSLFNFYQSPSKMLFKHNLYEVRLHNVTIKNIDTGFKQKQKLTKQMTADNFLRHDLVFLQCNTSMMIFFFLILSHYQTAEFWTGQN